MSCGSEPVSWLRLERYALGELDGAARDAVRDHLAACPTCHACLATIEADAPALPPLPARVAPRKFWTWPRLAWAGGMLAAAAIMLIVVGKKPPPASTGAVPEYRVKGGEDEVIVALVRERAGAVTAEAVSFDDGDRFSVRVTCAAPAPVFADVVVFQAGEVSFPLPASPLRCGNNVSFPGAFTLTGGAAKVCVAIDPARAPDRAAVQAAGPRGLACRDLAEELPPVRAGMCAALLDDTYFEETLPDHVPALGCLPASGDRATHVYVLCVDEAGFDALMQEARTTATDLAELPRGWAGARDGTTILQVRDDDAPCLVTVRDFAGDAGTLAKQLSSKLTPELAARIHALAP